VGLFSRLSPSKPSRRDPADKWKSAGAREHEAQRHDRRAEALEAAGNAAAAAAERLLAAQLRDSASKPRG
jgi:hypothetical protein